MEKQNKKEERMFTGFVMKKDLEEKFIEEMDGKGIEKIKGLRKEWEQPKTRETSRKRE